ncbi:MAG TPA: glycerol-3-phosphate dehydrogenase/oxidase [Chloroflexota bacterium]
MNRAEAVSRLNGSYDVLVVGGGATGLGVAVDSATRGYRTLLVTSGDFSQATSSRSTKLIHGGVRYLERGDIKLVREALRERGLLVHNAPHLVHDLRFLIPVYAWWQIAYYGAGLKAYDVLAGRLNLAPSRPVSRRGARALVPTIRTQGLKGGIAYSDGQFNDSRLAMALLRTAQRHGAVAVNYAEVTRLNKSGGNVSGAEVLDQQTGEVRTVEARVVVNATGIFTDRIRHMDDPTAVPIIACSQGTHIVLDRSFLPGDAAILVPRTSDGRVVFIIPWEGRTLVGTTDIPVDRPEMEPIPSEEEIAFLLRHAALYLSRAPRREDVLSAFAGLRPLVRGTAASTAQLSRDHTLLVSQSGLVTVTGGKWTTYRLMAQDAVTRAAEVGGLPAGPCVTQNLRLDGADATNPRWKELGANDAEIKEYEARYPEPIHERLPYSFAMAAYVIDREMPVELDDVLSRRLRALMLDAEASVEAAPRVVRLMAEQQGHDEAWANRQLERYRVLASQYGLGRLPAIPPGAPLSAAATPQQSPSSLPD